MWPLCKTNPSANTNPNPNTNPIQLFHAFFEHRPMIFKLASDSFRCSLKSYYYVGVVAVSSVRFKLYTEHCVQCNRYMHNAVSLAVVRPR